MARGPKVKKPKQLKIELLNPNDRPLHEPYRLMAEIRRESHPDIIDAKIAIAWAIDTKHDVDGHLTLGRCVKASDLQRELVDWDFVIVLNREVWQDAEFTTDKKRALLDHELMHADVSLDSEGEPKVDVKGRKVWRIRKHDIEEFTSIIRRHGCYKRDLENFAEAIMKRQGVLFTKLPEDQTNLPIN